MTPTMGCSPYTPDLQTPFLPRELQQPSMNRRARTAQGRTSSNIPEAPCAGGSSLSLCLYVKKKKSLLHTWVTLYTGPARSRVTVSCTLLEGTGSLPSQGGRERVCLSAFQNTLPASVSCHPSDCSLVSFAMFQNRRSPLES